MRLVSEFIINKNKGNSAHIIRAPSHPVTPQPTESSLCGSHINLWVHDCVKAPYYYKIIPSVWVPPSSVTSSDLLPDSLSIFLREAF